jgi:hypothetical protein
MAQMTMPRALPSGAATQGGVSRRRRDWVAVTLGLGTTAMSVASTCYYLKQHLILGFQDSYSHLEISRRLVTGLSPGVAQLGGVWLPVPQLLQSLFSWSFTLYRTGLAGALISMISYVAVTMFLYKLIVLYTDGRRLPAVAGALVFALNVDVLYQQSTPMDELPFFAFTAAAVYHLAKWGETRLATNLLTGSVAAMLAALCRYEGWFLAVVYVGCTVAMARRLGYSWSDVRGLTAVPALVASMFPIGGWLLYNLLVFGDAFAFMSNSVTANPATSAVQRAATYSSAGIDSWPLALKSYGIAVGSDIGLAVIVLGVLGLAVFLDREQMSARSLPVLGLLAIVPFFIVSLKLGTEPMSLPQEGGSLLNYRFGLIVLIPVAILSGYLVSMAVGKIAIPAAAIVIVALAGISFPALQHHQVVLAIEASQDAAEQDAQVLAGEFLADHTTGLILVDIALNQAADFDVIDRTIYDGSKEDRRNQWTAVLANPLAFNVHVIVMRQKNPAALPDVVYEALHDSPRLHAYRLVYSSSAYLIYSLR